MTCDFNGEMILPLPFTILAIVVACGLLIARFMKNRTNFLVSVMAFTDVILKTNWFFLLIILAVYKHFIAFSIILYCFLSNFVVNFMIWRKLFIKYEIVSDVYFSRYVEKFPRGSAAMIWMSYIASFHLFRLTYSKLFGKKLFSA